MKTTIWKYPLPPSINRFVTLDLPAGADVLSVANQGGDAFVWAVVSPDAAPQPRRFFVASTGGELPDEVVANRFIGTFMLASGALVFHLFEVQ